jgi:hypothetical protein
VEPLWRNPELIRHARTEMRPVRMATAAGVSVFLCVLLLLIFFHPGMDTTSAPRDLAAILYTLLASVQASVLGLWCLSSCSQAISSERSMKTFDFIRTTRLTSWELLLGMVFGVPLMAYFVVACTLPFTLTLGLYAGFSLFAMAVTYLMMLLVAVVLSLAALTISITTDRPRPGEVILLVIVIGSAAWATFVGFSDSSPFPGLTAILVVFGLPPLYNMAPGPYGPILTFVPFFNFKVPILFVSIFLYLSAGGWLFLILLRNLKKDREDIRYLSRWQAAGFAAYLNVLFLALLDLRHMGTSFASGISGVYLVLNFFLLYSVGLATLPPPSRLKFWRRLSASSPRFYYSEDGPPWPGMVASAIAAFLLFVLETVFAKHLIPFSEWPVGAVAGLLSVVLVFAARDVLFLQWCVVKGFQSPIVKGMLFLFLYYVAAICLAIFFLRSSLAWLTPLGSLGYPDTDSLLAIIFGLVLQIAVTIYFMIAIRRQLTPPAATSVVASAVTGP